MQLRSPMQYQFSQVPVANVERSAFKRQWSRKMTLNADYIYPMWCDEVIPGETRNFRGTIFVRLQSMVTPMIDNLWLDTFYFFVPNRLLQTNFVKMMGERDNPDDSIDFSVAQIVSPAVTGWAKGSLSDYLGLPIGVPNLSVSAYWHRAYNLIYRDWFRSQDLQASPVIDRGDADSDNAFFVLLKRTKRHDYITSCLPNPQKGDGVDIPLSGNAPVKGLGPEAQGYNTSNKTIYEAGGNAGSVYGKWVNMGSNFNYYEDPDNPGFPYIFADMSSVVAADINSLRLAFQMQRLLERDQRGGTRYIEMIKSHFGVTNPDFRLQRPEFLGGNSTLIMVTPVAQTSASGLTGGTTKQGNLAGFGTGVSHGEGFSKSFTEYGVILALCCIRGAITYQQAVPRMFRRETRYDFYLPVLAHLGEQAVLNSEVMAVDGTQDTDSDGTVDNDEVFGYQERWAELKYKQSEICGELRSTYATPLDSWHLAEEFADIPQLNDDFIVQNTPVSRVVAVTGQDHFIFDSLFTETTVRPMPMNCVPGYIDHF